MLNEPHRFDPAPDVLLSQISAGQTVELIAVQGGRRLRKRLADLGLNAGRRVRVVQNHFAGPLILAVQVDARLAIGRGTARQIHVRRVEIQP